jgi:hypothetical protein
MKHIVFAMSLLIAQTTSSQTVVDTIHYDGEVLEVVSAKLGDFRVTKDNNLVDLFREVQYAGFRLCYTGLIERIREKIPENSIIVSEPFKKRVGDEVLYLASTHGYTPVWWTSDNSTGGYVRLGWISSDPNTRWIVLRAVHQP